MLDSSTPPRPEGPSSLTNMAPSTKCNASMSFILEFGGLQARCRTSPNWRQMVAAFATNHGHSPQVSHYLWPTQEFGKDIGWIVFTRPFLNGHNPTAKCILAPKVRSRQVPDSTQALALAYSNRRRSVGANVHIDFSAEIKHTSSGAKSLTDALRHCCQFRLSSAQVYNWHCFTPHLD